MKPSTLGILTILFLAVGPITSFSAPRHTGIRGETWIYRGPAAPPGPFTQPVVRYFPVSASITILSAHSGRELARVDSGVNGTFEISLNPGNYILVPETLADPWSFGAPPHYYTPDPIEITVKPHEFTNPLIVYLFPSPSIPANPIP